jgi:hypothetical protein
MHTNFQLNVAFFLGIEIKTSSGIPTSGQKDADAFLHASRIPAADLVVLSAHTFPLFFRFISCYLIVVTKNLPWTVNN